MTYTDCLDPTCPFCFDQSPIAIGDVLGDGIVVWVARDGSGYETVTP